MAFKKGDRITYTWPNSLIGKPPFTDQGTVLRAHRDGSLTVRWDTHTAYGRKQWVNADMVKNCRGVVNAK